MGPHAIGYGDQGQIHIECPFSHEHTTESSESATSYFPAGTGGYQQGHFVCLHAHCQDRDEQEFIDALDLQLTTFEPLPPEPKTISVDTGQFQFDQRTGELKAIVPNLQLALSEPELCGKHIRFDAFQDDLFLTDHGKELTPANSRLLQEEDYFDFRGVLQSKMRFKPISQAMMREALLWVAKHLLFDCAQEWAFSKLPEWDKVDRFETWATTVWGIPNTPYNRACVRYWWSAHAGRLLNPGVQADMCVILVGRQGIRKTSLVKAIAPFEEWFCELSFADSEDNRARRTKGCLVGELGELRGLYASELNAVKAYMTRRHDEWIPKYQERKTKYARRVMFTGTTNHQDFLGDPTGERRFLPIRVETCNTDYVEQNRDQLWAQAIHMYKQSGIMYREAELLAPDVHTQFKADDPWEDKLSMYINKQHVDPNGVVTPAMDFVTTTELLEMALNLDASRSNIGHARHVADVMRSMGWEKKQRRVDGAILRGWSRITSLDGLM